MYKFMFQEFPSLVNFQHQLCAIIEGKISYPQSFDSYI